MTKKNAPQSYIFCLSISHLNNVFPLSALAVIEACPDKTIRKENTKKLQSNLQSHHKNHNKGIRF